MAVKTSERELSESELFAPDLDEGEIDVELFLLPDGTAFDDSYLQRVWDAAKMVIESGRGGGGIDGEQSDDAELHDVAIEQYAKADEDDPEKRAFLEAAEEVPVDNAFGEKDKQ